MSDVSPITKACPCEHCRPGGPHASVRAQMLKMWRAEFASVTDPALLLQYEGALVESWHKHVATITSEEHRRRVRVSNALPERAMLVAFNNDAFDETEQMAQLHQWYDSDDAIAVLSGPPGTGKTCAAARIALERFPEVKFFTAASLGRMARWGKERDELLDAACADLIVDDLGAEHLDAKGAFLADLDELVDAIYRDNRRAVFTTNCAPAAFAKRYGLRITDRLAECGAWIQFSGPSRRSRR